MKASSLFTAIVLAGTVVAAIAGCGGGGVGPAPIAISHPPLPTPTPAARHLYVDHNGTLFEYALPLTAAT